MNFRRFTGTDNKSIIEIDVTKIEAIHQAKEYSTQYGTDYECSYIYFSNHCLKVMEGADKILETIKNAVSVKK